MSSAPSETTCGRPELARRLEPVGPGGEDAADEVVGAARSSSGRARRRGSRRAASASIDWPPGAGRVEDEHLVAELLEPLARPRHRGRRDAEHRRPDQRPSSAALGDRAPWPSRRSRRPRSRGSAPRSGSARRCRRPSRSSSRRSRPTYGRVSPRRRVETISFGTPTGSARIACAAIDELPEPPTAAGSRRAGPPRAAAATISAAPRPIASTAAPRSPASRERGDVRAGRARRPPRAGRRPRRAARRRRRRRGAPRRRARAAARAGSRTPCPLVSSVPSEDDRRHRGDPTSWRSPGRCDEIAR